MTSKSDDELAALAEQIASGEHANDERPQAREVLSAVIRARDTIDAARGQPQEMPIELRIVSNSGMCTLLPSYRKPTPYQTVIATLTEADLFT